MEPLREELVAMARWARTTGERSQKFVRVGAVMDGADARSAAALAVAEARRRCECISIAVVGARVRHRANL